MSTTSDTAWAAGEFETRICGDGGGGEEAGCNEGCYCPPEFEGEDDEEEEEEAMTSFDMCVEATLDAWFATDPESMVLSEIESSTSITIKFTDAHAALQNMIMLRLMYASGATNTKVQGEENAVSRALGKGADRWLPTPSYEYTRPS